MRKNVKKISLDNVHEQQRCPISNTHKRLIASFISLQSLIDNYQDETLFTESLNNLIQNLRNTTFILQKELAHTEGFKKWYEQEQEKMRRDTKMKWLHDSRTAVVHEADLEKNSFARISVKDHRDHLLKEVKVNPQRDLKTLAKEVLPSLRLDIPANLESRILVQIEKYWIADSYPDAELAELTIYCLDYLRDLIERVHKDLFSLGQLECSDIPYNHLLRSSRAALENTVKSKCTAHMNYKTGEFFSGYAVHFSIDKEVSKKDIIKRYGGMENLIAVAALSEDSPFDKAEFHKEMIKRCFNADSCVVPIVFLYFPNNEPIIMSFKFKNPAERYLVFETIANKVKETGCEAVVWISEAWVGRMPRQGEVFIPPTEQKNKEIAMIVMANPHKTVAYSFEIIRKKFRKPRLSDDVKISYEDVIAFERIYKIWREQGS